jgi:hypothetical protein
MTDIPTIFRRDGWLYLTFKTHEVCLRDDLAGLHRLYAHIPEAPSDKKILGKGKSPALAPGMKITRPPPDLKTRRKELSEETKSRLSNIVDLMKPKGPEQ